MRLGRLSQRERLANVDLESAVAHEGKAAVGALAHLVGEAPGHARQHEAAHLLGLREEREDVEGVRRSPGAPVQDDARGSSRRSIRLPVHGRKRRARPVPCSSPGICKDGGASVRFLAETRKPLGGVLQPHPLQTYIHAGDSARLIGPRRPWFVGLRQSFQSFLLIEG